jgi:hypothetical protein
MAQICIDQVPCHCPSMSCGWEGVTGDCEPCENEPDPGCPRCGKRVVIQYDADGEVNAD